MSYQISYEKRALHELEKLETSISRRIIIAVEGLAQDPSSKDIKKLKGKEDYYRLRVGNYRIIFVFEGSSIKILKIGNRQQIYE